MKKAIFMFTIISLLILGWCDIKIGSIKSWIPNYREHEWNLDYYVEWFNLNWLKAIWEFNIQTYNKERETECKWIECMRYKNNTKVFIHSPKNKSYGDIDATIYQSVWTDPKADLISAIMINYMNYRDWLWDISKIYNKWWNKNLFKNNYWYRLDWLWLYLDTYDKPQNAEILKDKHGNVKWIEYFNISWWEIPPSFTYTIKSASKDWRSYLEITYNVWWRFIWDLINRKFKWNSINKVPIQEQFDYIYDRVNLDEEIMNKIKKLRKIVIDQ